MRVENGKLKLLSRDKKKAKNRKLAQRTAAPAAAAAALESELRKEEAARKLCSKSK